MIGFFMVSEWLAKVLNCPPFVSLPLTHQHLTLTTHKPIAYLINSQEKYSSFKFYLVNCNESIAGILWVTHLYLFC